jgi:hypothetical protein
MVSNTVKMEMGEYSTGEWCPLTKINYNITNNPELTENSFSTQNWKIIF